MSVTSIDKDLDSLTMTVTAEFDVTADRAWQLWADPRQLERWWGPPTYPATVEEHDLRPGGKVTYFMTGPDDDWQARRREAAGAQAERAARNRAVEVAKARELVAGFVAEARRRRLATQPLRVRAGDSRDTYACGLVGWSLRRDGSLAVAEDGEMYVLTAPKSLRARRLAAPRLPVVVGPGHSVDRGAARGRGTAGSR